MTAGPELTLAQRHVLNGGDALQLGAAADNARHGRRVVDQGALLAGPGLIAAGLHSDSCWKGRMSYQ